MATRRAPYRKTEAQRQKILDAAIETFAQRGSRASALREIAERAGMSQAGLLHHFRTKNELLMAALREYERREEERPSSPDLRGQADRLRGLLTDGAAHPGYVQLLVTLAAEAVDPEHPAHDFFVERYDRVNAQFRRPLQEAVERGDLPADAEVDAASRLLIAAMDGLQLQLLLEQDVDVLASYELLVQALLSRYAGTPNS